MPKWYEQVRMDPGNNYVSSRVRLSRNWADYKFPNRLSTAEAEEMLRRIHDSLDGFSEAAGEPIQEWLLAEIPEIRRMAMRERRLLNASILDRKAPVGVLISQAEDISLILNGDDHFRLQCLSPNAHLYELWDKADKLDDCINEHFNYAFDDRYGYLTAFPTNVGTGMRANIVVHLPALSTGKQFPSLLESMTRFGVTIRGVYGTGKENFGALYDISNAKTLGISEREILDLVTKVASQLNSQENQVRRNSLESHRTERMDQAYKSYGILKYARKLSLRDALIYLSHVMAGFTDGILKTEQPFSVYRLYLGIQPSNLIASSTTPVDREKIDEVRADYLRCTLPELTDF